jgi:hypothetical protein
MVAADRGLAALSHQIASNRFVAPFCRHSAPNRFSPQPFEGFFRAIDRGARILHPTLETSPLLGITQDRRRSENEIGSATRTGLLSPRAGAISPGGGPYPAPAGAFFKVIGS